MNVRNLVQAGAARLRVAGIEATRPEAWVLLAWAAERSRAALMAGSDDALPPAIRSRFEAAVERRATQEPLAYIVGEKEFWSLGFRVSPAVLIPRPDSETLVEAALDHLRSETPGLVLDLGTGSGCLLLAVLSERSRVFGIGIDQSEAAARLAYENARRLGLEDRCSFVVSDWAAAVAGTFDLILCNPPYVSEGEMAALAPDVAAFEPRAALAAGADGLAAYRRLAPAFRHLLRPDGVLCLEVGQGQADAVGALLRAAGLAMLGVRPDLAGIARCVIAGLN